LLIRLQKYLRDAGISSRRKCEELIEKGLVKVNGQVITQLGFKINPQKDRVEFKNKKISPAPKLVYLMLNKPPGYLCTLFDPFHRKTVLDLIKIDPKVRIFPVGRLDYQSEGLLLLTNDGYFAHQIIHPRFQIDKVYQVKLNGYLSTEKIQQLQKGFFLEEGKIKLKKVKVISRQEKESFLEITLHSGQKRVLRRIFEKLGFKVLSLKRIQLGKLKLGNLKLGEFRNLTETEISWFLKNEG
jgi:pseudouridine synthase